nr:glycoside hydrolase [Lachnospiraceae bacterium]
MHGGGGNEEEFIYGQDRSLSLLHILDNMIERGDLEPLIVVTPSFYYSDSQSAFHDIKEAGVLTKFYHNEFRNDLLPVIDSKYRTIADREHRAFSGFSMGSETTWEVFLNCLDLVKNYMPLSGDCWIVEQKGGATYPEKTSALMKEYIKDKGFDDLSYNIFAFTGDEDIAFPALNAQIAAMMKDGWNEGKDKVLKYESWKEGTHCYQYIYEYIYNVLPELF